MAVQSLSRVRLFAIRWIAARQASLSITNSRSLPKLLSIELVMLCSHLILCRPLLLLPPIPPSIRVFSNESVLSMRWPKYWSFSFSIIPSMCLTLCNPMNCNTPGLPVHHQLPEFTQTHVHWVGDAIQPSHPLSSPSPPAPNPSQLKLLLKVINWNIVTNQETCKNTSASKTFHQSYVLCSWGRPSFSDPEMNYCFLKIILIVSVFLSTEDWK